MGYRDDREALRQQVEELRREVEALRGASVEEGGLAERVEMLAKEVNVALDQLAKDREVLKKLGGALTALNAVVAKTNDAEHRIVDRPANREGAIEREPSTPPSGEQGSRTTESARGEDKPVLWKYGLAACALIVGVSIVAGLRESSSSTVSPIPDEVRLLADIPGAPNHADPLALLSRAEGLAGPQAELTSIDAWYVSEDGTLDLLAKAYEARVTFHYEGPAPPAPPVDSSIPLGAPRPYAPGAPHFCVELRRVGGLQKCSAAFLVEHPVKRPSCSMRAVWAAARAAGAPSNAVAHLTYKQEIFGKYASWTFRIEPSLEYEISDPECRVRRPSTPGLPF